MKITTSFRIDEEVFNNLKRIADRKDRTVSYVINDMLEKGIAQDRKNVPQNIKLKTEND